MLAAKPPSILLVDDDVRAARLLVRLLEGDGFEVELATDGAAAIARLTRLPGPDLLVTDLRLPYADGLAIARYARSRNARLPVFVVTGYPEFVDEALDGAAPVGVYAKPLDYEQLRRDLRCAAGVPLTARPPAPLEK
jgi:CheY-like chemotaxis protein